MSDLVAKRYVKALLDGDTIENVTSIYDDMKLISTAYSDDKFISIISSSEIATDDKLNLIGSFVENSGDKLNNLLKLLAANKRLDIVPNITSELKKEISVLSNQYEGVVYTNVKLSDEELSSIEDKFAKKFNITLTLTQNICDYDGIKVDIDGLGVEIGFSKDRLRTQMIEHILKAV